MSAASEFDRDTAVHPRADEPGVFDAGLSAGWAIGHALNGGYLLAVLGRALGEALPHADPFTISAHYLSATTAGPAVVRTETIRTGRTMSTGSAGLFQTDESGEEVERIRVLGTYGELATLPEDVRTSAKPPEIPPLERCFGQQDNPAGADSGPAMGKRLDLRLDPATCGWALGAPAGKGEMRAWFQLADGRAPDPLSLLMTVDALPPTAFELGLSGWVPTVELTVHVRALPAPGPLRVAITTRNLAGGYLEEDTEIWDSADRLVAQSRQLARAKLG
ncbi:thioesterase family protein [Streptomyces sp. HNM0574]|uniref:thioesterase family protein n=1 Tax=Streptomyces sp. HNM0574 TaxID=2714954 RepID=UPI00146A7033|nr:thioesterase family protein [Streptomyces sp. HNM0574]NLU67028.1 thioesterase family protein [Streptomyces sp. HNM0574]